MVSCPPLLLAVTEEEDADSPLIATVVFVETYDVTWEGFWMWVWAAVECNLGVICGCVPAIRPLMSKLAPVLTARGASTDSSKKSRSNGKWSLATIGSAGVRQQQQGGSRHKGPRMSTNLDHDGDYVELDRVALRSSTAHGGPNFDAHDYPHAGGLKTQTLVVTTTLDISSTSSDLERGEITPLPFPLPPSMY